MSHETENHLLVGISMGDFNGIGPEIILKTFSDSRMQQLCTPILYGSGKVLSHYRKVLNLQEFNFQTIRKAEECFPRKINVINCIEDELKIEPGKASDESGAFALKALDLAIDDLRDSKIHALVTAPVDKHSVKTTEPFTGHTGYLGKKFKVEDPLMILVSGKLKVALFTGHVPLQKVANLMNSDRIADRLFALQSCLKSDFGITKPRIAVLGLNPHAGDQGVIGTEDQEKILPAIKSCFDKGMHVFGPFPADGFFGSGQYLKYDAVLAMYHDQGLIPFKTLAFETGVNYTWGLPAIRTSPDHGTAYDLAGKGTASESSFREAIYLACDAYARRNEYQGLTSRPLVITRKGSER